MPNNVEQYKLKSMSKVDLKAHRTALNNLINEMNGIYVTGPMMDKYGEAKDWFAKAKEDLDDVISMKDTTSLEAVKQLREYQSTMDTALFKLTEVNKRTRENAIFKKQVNAACEKGLAARDSVIGVIDTKMKPYTDKAKKVTDKKLGLFLQRRIKSKENNQTLTGGQPFNTSSPAGYTMTRTAVHSTTVGYLLSQGYTPEQIFDPTQLAEKKQEAFREVAAHMNGGTAEDQKWMAEVFVNGVGKIIDTVNEIGREITPEEANLQNKKFVDLVHLSSAWHDITQEMDRCKEEITSYVRDVKKEDPEAYWTDVNKKGLLTQIGQMFSEEASMAKEIMNPSKKLVYNLESLTRYIISNNHSVKTFFKLREENPDTPASKLGSDDNYIAGSVLNENELMNSLQTQYGFRDLSVDQRFGIVDHLLNSGELENADYTGDKISGEKVVIHGIPSRNELLIAGAAYGENRDQMMASLAKNIDAAQTGVSFGSSEYNEAAKAVKALSEQLKDYGAKVKSKEITRNRDKVPVYKEMREKARIAEEKINKYLELKDSQGLLGGGASPKTQKRINVMKKALLEVKKSREMFEAKLVEMHTERAQGALQQKYIAERAIDDIALNAKGKKLTDEEKVRLSKGVAAASVCGDELSRLSKDPKAEPKTVQELVRHAERRVTSKPFKDTVKLMDRKDARNYVTSNKAFNEHFKANHDEFMKQVKKNAARAKGL